MTITIYPDRIEFGNNSIKLLPGEDNTLGSTSGGSGSLYFEGNLQAVQFIGKTEKTVAGYSAGGLGPPVGTNTLDKFSFAGGNFGAAQVSSLSTTKSYSAGQSSSTHGYISSASQGSKTFPGSGDIEKFLFSNEDIQAFVGTLSGPVTRAGSTGHSSSTYGYIAGGFNPPEVNNIDKFPFATDANAVDVGDLTRVVETAAGQSSTENGYVSGGDNGPTTVNIIDKFPFASDSNATDVGDLTRLGHSMAGQSSTENGYTSGGFPTSNVIDKFPFASDTNASDVGDLTEDRYSQSSASSSIRGYNCGGINISSTIVDTIDYFPFAFDGNASDIGNLSSARSRIHGGNEY